MPARRQRRLAREVPVARVFDHGAERDVAEPLPFEAVFATSARSTAVIMSWFDERLRPCARGKTEFERRRRRPPDAKLDCASNRSAAHYESEQYKLARREAGRVLRAPHTTIERMGFARLGPLALPPPVRRGCSGTTPTPRSGGWPPRKPRRKSATSAFSATSSGRGTRIRAATIASSCSTCCAAISSRTRISRS